MRSRLQRARCAGLAAACGALVACAHGPPALRAGLWEIHGARVENPGDKRSDFSYTLCRDHAYDQAADAALANVKGCRTQVRNLAGGKFSSASTCVVNGTTVESQAVSVYKGDTALHSDTRAVYSPPVDGKSEELLAQDQQYVSKCPSGLQPGDVQTPDGLVRHHAER